MLPCGLTASLVLFCFAVCGPLAVGVRVEEETEEEETALGIKDDLAENYLNPVFDHWLRTAVERRLKAAMSLDPFFRESFDQSFETDQVVVPLAEDWAKTVWQLSFMMGSCDKGISYKSLGKSEESSRSGAAFMKCAAPQSNEDFKRIILKGGIRDSSSSPEWSAFMKMRNELQLRYEDKDSPTLLNKVVLGFDLMQYHWLALQDMGASNIPSKLAQLGLELSHTMSFDAFDLKPLPSRAPELPDMLVHLKSMPLLAKCPGWSDLREALQKDLAFLDEHKVVDQSLFVQVAGPVPIKGKVDEKKLLATLSSTTPRCVYHYDEQASALSVFCFSVFDYFLTWNFMKSLQNTFQSSRWTDYSDKMLQLFDCLGHLAGEGCAEYRKIVAREWRLSVEKAYPLNHELMKVAREKEAVLRCCCDTAATDGVLSEETECHWKTPPALWGCPDSLAYHYVQNGGCLKWRFGQLVLTLK